MMRMRALSLLILATVMPVILCGCPKNSRDEILATPASQVAMRAYQSRVFDTGDKIKTLRAVVSALQDLDFVIDKTDVELGSVTGSKTERGTTRITVTVHQKSPEQTVVRANAQVNISAVDNPEYYQSFFNVLEKAMFLNAHLDE
jgi:hypothetical protein